MMNCTKTVGSLLVAAAIASGLAACAGGDNVLAGTVYLPTIPRGDLLGAWSPRRTPPSFLQSLFSATRSSGPEILTIAPDETCAITSDLARHLVSCEHVSEAAALRTGGCAWSIQSRPEGEGLAVVFQAPDGKWHTTGFGVFRQMANRGIALLGTCGSGDAYGLFRSVSAVRG